MRRVLITGGQGRLARSIAPGLHRRGWDVIEHGHTTLDITDPTTLRAAIASARPDTIINLAAWTDVDACETDPDGAWQVNATAVAHVRDAAAEVGAHLVHVSTDYVFDGEASRPYREDDQARPLGAYGRSKLAGEHEAGPAATVLRLAWISGRHGRSLVQTILDLARDDGPLRFVDDRLGSPTVAEDLVEPFHHVLTQRPPGTFHVANAGSATPWDVARVVLHAAGMDPDRVQPISSAEWSSNCRAARPAYTVLDTTKFAELGGPTLRPWQASTADLVADLVGAPRVVASPAR